MYKNAMNTNIKKYVGINRNQEITLISTDSCFLCLFIKAASSPFPF